MMIVVVVMHPCLGGDFNLCTCMLFGIRVDYSFLLLQKISDDEELEKEE